ncbi:MAG: hypothetical protein NVSMB26_18110 [Beijerinckiaceae bacterium]
MSDPHWGFIIAAYAVAAFVIGGMSLKIWLDYRGLAQALARLTSARDAEETR